jgi:hypothetical protein
MGTVVSVTATPALRNKSSSSRQEKVNRTTLASRIDPGGHCIINILAITRFNMNLLLRLVQHTEEEGREI